MMNTMKKVNYIIENAEWCIIVFLWYKTVLFRCISNYTYMESMMVFCIIFVSVIGMGIWSTWKRARNYVSVVENMVIACGTYVVLAYQDIYRKHFVIIGVLTFIVTFLRLYLILFRKIRNIAKRKQIISNRINKCIQCVRRNTCIAMCVILIPLSMSVFFKGTYLNSNVEATQIYGEEHSLSANIELISNIDPVKWSMLDVQGKLNVCQCIINTEARYYGISHEITIGTQQLAEGTLGYYKDTNHLVVIDINHLKYGDSYEVLNTCLHEVYHAYQYEQVRVYTSLDERMRGLLLFYPASEYLNELSDYKNAKEDYGQYYDQSVETDARRAAEIGSQEYIDRVNEYLSKISEQERGDAMLFITGDTHGEENRFTYMQSEIEKTLTKEDKLFVCGDWGYISDDSYKERQFLRFLAEKPYQILFVDGNHENFSLLNEYPVGEWSGGKVHVIRRDVDGNPKLIHLMRGQVFTIEGKRIFTMGGGYSLDKYMRTPYRSWWPEEMPTDAEMQEAISNLKKYNDEVDYIITHTAPLETMCMIRQINEREKPLNNFLEWVRENVKYSHWYMGHLHEDTDLWKNQTIVWFQLRNMETNEVVEG